MITEGPLCMVLIRKKDISLPDYGGPQYRSRLRLLNIFEKGPKIIFHL